MSSFQLRVGIDASGARRGGSEVRDALNRIRGGAGATEKRLNRLDRSLRDISSAGVLVRRTIGGLFAGAAARQIIQAADAYTRLGNRIGLVTENSQQAAIIQRELFELADRARAPINEIGTLYGRAALAADQLGASQGELLQFTEGVAQALAINGSTAAESAGALVQLSQALGGGIVRAEEFNSVLEGARPVLTAVADGLGISISELRSLVVEGKVTSREFFEAFQSQLGNIDAQFKETNKTIGQAGTEINNAFIEAVGTVNEFSGAGDGLTQILSAFANLVRGPLLEGLLAFSFNVGILIQDFDNLFTTIGDVARQVVNFTDNGAKNTKTYGEAVLDNLLSPFQTLRKFIQILTIQVTADFDALVGRFKVALGFFKQDANLITEGQEQIARAAEVQLQTITEVFNESRASVEKFKESLRDARGEFSEEQRTAALAAVPTVTRVSGSGTGTGTDTDALDKLREQVAQFEATNNPLQNYAQQIREIVDLQNAAAAEGIVISADAIKNAYAEAANELTGFNDLLAEGRDLTESLRTPQEEYNAAIERFTELLNRGAINEETFNRAREAAKKTLEESSESFEFLKEVGRSAAEDIQGAFVDLFLGVADGGEALADQLGQTLQRIAANFLANQAIKALLNAGGSAFGGSFGAALTSFAGEFDSGGRIPSGQFGLVGERGPELVSGPANVTSRADTAAMMAPDLSVNVVNVADPAAAIDALATNAGEKNIVNNIRRNREAVRRELGLA